ncbi:MAG: sigma factor-like helix-turn-helix DNA-binding protein [Oscillospiraceae bacterium]|nr:sigma factor-like helix-turn-helix DNA-binding protein [Oscillospiraceae bacterium]
MAKNLESSFLLDFYGSLLGEKQRRLFAQYYDDDLSLSEIADLEGMTRQGVRDAVKRAEHQLGEMEAKLGLARRFQQVQQGLLEIRQCAKGLEAVCGQDPEAAQTLDRLLSIVDQLEKTETE